MLSPSLPGITGVTLTSVGDEDCLVFCLYIMLAAIRGRECYPVLTGVKLAVNLGTGPCQHLTESKEEQHSCLHFKPGLQQASVGRRAALAAQRHMGLLVCKEEGLASLSLKPFSQPPSKQAFGAGSSWNADPKTLPYWLLTAVSPKACVLPKALT